MLLHDCLMNKFFCQPLVWSVIILNLAAIDGSIICPCCELVAGELLTCWHSDNDSSVCAAPLFPSSSVSLFYSLAAKLHWLYFMAPSLSVFLSLSVSASFFSFLSVFLSLALRSTAWRKCLMAGWGVWLLCFALTYTQSALRKMDVLEKEQPSW